LRCFLYHTHPYPAVLTTPTHPGRVQELYYRHLYAKGQPGLRERCESWDNYCDLFGVILHGEATHVLGSSPLMGFTAVNQRLALTAVAHTAFPPVLGGSLLLNQHLGDSISLHTVATLSPPAAADRNATAAQPAQQPDSCKQHYSYNGTASNSISGPFNCRAGYGCQGMVLVEQLQLLLSALQQYRALELVPVA
jgi:hypothetical protein